MLTEGIKWNKMRIVKELCIDLSTIDPTFRLLCKYVAIMLELRKLSDNLDYFREQFHSRDVWWLWLIAMYC